MTGEQAAPPVASLWKNRNFLILSMGRMVGSSASQMQGVAVGWHVYDLTREPLALGYVGLSLFLPMMLLTLPAGDFADRFNRRRVLLVGQALQVVASAAILLLTLTDAHGSLVPFYAALAVFGAGRALAGPAQSALLPLVVPAEQLGRAVAIASSAYQSSVIAGPALGGLLYMAGPAVTYGLCCLLLALVCVGNSRLSVVQPPRDPSALSALERLREGVVYVRHKPILLGAMSLDLFAVLLGGATALLPVYARDILHVGPQGLGLLRSAPAFGAVALGLILGSKPLSRHAGATMLACVGLFGAATVVFGLSESFILSLGCLLVMGATDMVSVYVRQTLVQLTTPDAMRGRVSAVSLLFIGASNELGEFESGITASWFGAVPAVVIGGLGTLGVVALWAVLFPSLRKVDRLEDLRYREEGEKAA